MGVGAYFELSFGVTKGAKAYVSRGGGNVGGEVSIQPVLGSRGRRWMRGVGMMGGRRGAVYPPL